MADFIFDIDTKFIDRLEKAEKALEDLVVSTNKVTESFEKLATGGLSQFSTAIDKIVNKIDSLSSTKIGDFGVTDTANKVVSAVDDIDKAYETVRKIKEESAAQNSDIPREEYVIVDTKKLEKEAEALENAIKRVERSQNYYHDKHQKLVDADSAPSKIRDAEVQLETKTEELSRLIGKLSKVKENIAKAQASNKEAVSNMLTNTVDGFMPIASLKSYINEINALLHEVPSSYPDPSEQQKVVDQLISLRKRYTDAMKSSEQKAQEYAKAKHDNAIDLAREYEAAEDGYDKLEKLEESHYEKTRAWREKNISDQSREDLYADEIKAYEEQVKAKAKADEDFAKREDARIKERDAALDAAAKAADKRDEEVLKENEAFVEKIRTKYADLIRETRQVSQELTRIEGLEQKYGDDIDVSAQKSAYADRLAQLNQERIEIERDHQDKISSIQAEETKKRMRDEVDAAERAARQVIEARKKAEKDEEKYRGTYRGAMEYSKNTKSIQEQLQAIKYLKQARESLKRTDFSSEEEYRKALNSLTLEIDRQTDSIKELNLESKKTNAISGQLKTAITNVVGIGAIKGYVSQLVRIRGEFELQHKSLQVLLRNKDEANRLWEQTIDMAVKSPYRVDQLVTATKQLAAYRVETERLHSTTKMLADLSSGLGVEINRLILAFGQVKAANFLRGTELRQFSEAGINILDELAAHYTELEGRMVSVGDVFDRVSKRMVSFADVETVLQKMTSEGGQFYKMQEQQAETLRGMTMNLKDSIMLMYNDIGEATDGVLKGTLTFFKHMVDNWKSYANIITTVVGALTGYKAAIIASKLVISLWSTVANIAAVATVKLGSSATWAAARVRLLNRAMSVNPFLRFISIITAMAGAIFGLGMSFDKTEEGAKNYLQILDENTIAAKNTAAGIKELTDERNELLKVESRSAEQEKRLNDITSARARLLGELTTVNEEYAKSLKLAGDDSEAMTKAIEEQNAKIESQLALAYNLKNIDWEKISNAQTSQGTKIGAEAKYSVTDKSKVRIEGFTPGIHADWDPVIEYLKESISSGVELAEVIEGLKESTKKAGFNYEKKKDRIADIIRQKFPDGGIGDIIADYIEADTVVDETFNELDQKIAVAVSDFSKGTYGKMLAEGFSSGIDETKNDALKKLQDYWRYIFAKKNITESAQKLFIDQVAKIFNLEEDWFTKQISKELSPWQKGYNALLDTLTKDRKIPSLTPVDATTSIKDQTKALNEFKETQEAIIKQYEDQQKYKVMLPIHSEEDADNAKKNLDVVQQLLEALGKIAKSNKTDTRYTNLIKTVNDVYSAFDKLEEKFGDTIATEMLWRDYAESIDTAFKRVGKSAEWVREQFGDLNSRESLKSALDWIAENTSTKEARLQAKTASAKISVDLEIEARDKAFDKLTKQVEDMFSGYELTIELDKLHVPKEFAKDFFNIDNIDITELRKRITDLKPQFDAKGAEKEYQAYLDKLDEMEAKSQQERLKKYQEFAKKAIGERAKIMLDSFYESQEIDKAFELTNTMALNKGLIDSSIKTELDSLGVTISDLLEMTDEEIMSDWFLTEDDISRLREFNDELQRQRNIVKEEANKQTKAELDKEAWEQFQATDTFQTMMSDLENMSEAAIGKMIEQLEEYKAQWKDMPVSDIKQLVDVIDKLKDAQAAFSSPRGLKRILEGYLTEGVNVLDEDTGITAATYHFDSVEDAQTQLVDSDLKIQLLEEELALVEEIETLRNQGIQDEEILAQLKEQGVHNENEIGKALGKSSKNLKDSIKDERNRNKAASKVAGVVDDIKASYKEQAKRIQKVQDLTDSLFDGWDAINSLFEDDSMSAALADMSKSILNGVLNMIMLQGETFAATVAAEGLGVAINAAMGPIGWIVLAIQALTKILKFALEQHDKNLQAQIDVQTEKVEKLKMEYETLEKAIEKAYTSADLGRLTREATENLEDQIEATEKMIALEEDKKKTDEDAIKGWEDDIRDMKESIEELHEETFSTLTAGIMDDVLSASRDFVDAWYDAFKETGDGMKGLKDSFKEMLLDMLKQQASMNVMGKYMDQYKEWLNDYIDTENGDDILTKDEAAEYAVRVKETFDNVNMELEGYLGAMDEIASQFDTGELSGLQKGIQGITEDQAEVLASYWNSCRYLIANIDTTLSDVATNVLGGSNNPNSIISELRKQTGILDAIYDQLKSVIRSDGGSNHNGEYIKVFDM